MIISRNIVKNVALSLVTVAVLTACHSGKTPRTAPPTPTPAPTPTPTDLSLKVADGYLKGAFVFLDVNKNSSFDDGEPSGETGVGGAVTLDTTGIENPENYPIIALATVDKTIDEDTNSAVKQAFSMSTPAGNTVINPVTTLVQSKISKAQAAGDVLTIADAIVAVANDLGLTDATNEQILGDYLIDKGNNAFKQKIHAIARSVVQLLPADAKELANNLDEKNAALKAISDAITAAINTGGDADSITVVVKDDGEIDVSLPAVSDAKAFIADFRTWGAQIEAEINDPAASFGNKADAGEAVINAKLDMALINANKAIMVIVQASNDGLLDELSINDFVGATGTVSSEVSETDTQHKEAVALDLMYGSDVVKISADVLSSPVADSEKSKTEISITGTLSNEDAVIELTTLDFSVSGFQKETDTQSQSYHDADIALMAKISAKSLKEHTGLFEGNVTLNGKWVELTDTDNDLRGVFKPTLASLSGSFGHADESFNAALKIEATKDYSLSDKGELDESAQSWVNAIATLELDIDLADFSGASVAMEVTRNGLETGLVNATLSYGERLVDLSINTDDDTGMLKVTNEEGILVTLQTRNVSEGDIVGEVFLGVKQVGVITLVGNVHKIKYADGSFETLF